MTMEPVEVNLPTGLVVALDEWAQRLGVDGSRVARAWWNACRDRRLAIADDDGETVTLEMGDDWSSGVDNPKAALRGTLVAAQARAERSGMVDPATGDVIVDVSALDLDLEQVNVGWSGKLLRCVDCGRVGVLAWLRMHPCGGDRSVWAARRRAARGRAE